MRKVISFIASGYRKDKIWLRRTKAAKREYQVLLWVCVFVVYGLYMERIVVAGFDVVLTLAPSPTIPHPSSCPFSHLPHRLC